MSATTTSLVYLRAGCLGASERRTFDDIEALRGVLANGLLSGCPTPPTAC